MASLRELQQSFAAALLDPAAACGVTPTANLDVYRHNREAQWRAVLGISFPVVRRRVGDDYFRGLAQRYRVAHPSRSGDLHWLGRHFPEFLAAHLGGTEYAWLADLARLEWLREVAAIAAPDPALAPDVLADRSPEELARLRFRLQPSLGLLRSAFPVFSVWMENQTENAPPVDQSLGEECGLVLARHDGVDVLKLDAAPFSYISALAKGVPMGDAVAVAALDEAALLQSLRFLFAQGLVCGVSAAT